MLSPAKCLPSEVDEETLSTVGAIPSITIALFAPREPDAPGDGRVRVTLLDALSLMVPLFADREFVTL